MLTDCAGNIITINYNNNIIIKIIKKFAIAKILGIFIH